MSSTAVVPPISSDLHSTEEGLISAVSSLFGTEKQIIKWIPKGARAHCATLLTRLFNSVADYPNSLVGWANLLSFAFKILAKPSRGGKARNLSNIIAKRCKNFHFITESDLRAGSLGDDSREVEQTKNRVTGSTRKGDTQENRLAKLVSLKIEEGNYKGAVRLISSGDRPTPPSAEGLRLLQEKHPPAHIDRLIPSLPSNPQSGADFTTEEVLGAVRSFPPGSSGGPDGLSPQHLRDLLSVEGAEGTLLQALSSVTNMITSGGVPDFIQPLFWWKINRPG